MITKTYLNSLLAALGLFAVVAGSQAATVSCTGPGYDLLANLARADACLILSPLDGAVNDVTNPPASSYIVNTESFFGQNTWQFDGQFGVAEQTNSSNFFDFSGNGQAGGYGFKGTDSSIQFMFVMKDGTDTNLVAYLLNAPVSSITETYTTPFTSPPFSFTGATTSKDISHISVYYLSDPGGPSNGVPEPGTIAMLGLGLLGMGLISRYRKSGQY